MTEIKSRSLGVEEYLRRLLPVGLSISNEYNDNGQSHYYDAFKKVGLIFREITPVKRATGLDQTGSKRTEIVLWESASVQECGRG